MAVAPVVLRRRIKYHRPFLYKKQEEALFHGYRYGVVEASTKAGKTHGCICWLCEQAIVHGGPGRNYWWIAPIFSQAEIAYTRMKRALPSWMYKSNESKMTITLLNGSVLWFKSADKPDSLFGEDVYAAVIDEATRCKENAWYAIRSTLTATRGKLRIIGNVKGRKNWAYKLGKEAKSQTETRPENQFMHYAMLTAYDAAEGGVFPVEEIEDAKRILPIAVFNELYMCEPADDGGNPFGLPYIAACVVKGAIVHPDGKVSYPGRVSKPVKVWGWDLGKSNDSTVGVGLDEDGYVAEFHRWLGPWEMTMRKIPLITGSTIAFVDSTGVGDAILEMLQKSGNKFVGYPFNPGSKQKLMEGLAVTIQQLNVHYPDGVLKEELDDFEYEYTRTGVKYSAPQGLHDDCVCALSLAVKASTVPAVTLGGGMIDLF